MGKKNDGRNIEPTVHTQPVEAEVLSREEADALIASISGNVGEIETLSKKLEQARTAASAAQKKVDQAKEAAESAKRKADSLKKTGIFGKGKAINELQESVQDLAKATDQALDADIALATAQEEAAKAQQVTFEFQKAIGKITQVMVQMSCASIANNRLMLRHLQATLSGASKEQLSAMAKQELENVVLQIKAQQDVMHRQQQLAGRMAENETAMERVRAQIQEQDAQLKDSGRRDEAQDAQIAANAAAIAAQTEQGERRDVRLDEGDRRDEAQDRKDREHDARLDAMDSKEAALRNDLDVALARIAVLEEKLTRKPYLSLVTMIGSAVALILSVLRFLI